MITGSKVDHEPAPLKISVVMIDGGFRENIFGAATFSRQDFLDDEYEVLWVEYFDRPHAELCQHPRVNVQPLGRDGIYHSSYCFNHGIARARGEVIVIPDADQIAPPDFLRRIWDIHQRYEKLVVYGYRYDEMESGTLQSHDLAELQAKCVLKNPTNYGGCLSVRKKWLLELNGYEQHPIFRTGNHANGLDMFTRFKNFGLAVQWEPSLVLYHPWHPFTLQRTIEHEAQEKLIQWRKTKMQWQAFQGIDPSRNCSPPERMQKMMDRTLRRLEREASDPAARGAAAATKGRERKGFFSRLLGGRQSRETG